MKKDGNRKEAIEKLTELIKVSPQNEEYYLDIINLHLQEGNREAALGWSQWVGGNPRKSRSDYKRASILAELARYPETLVFIREQMRKIRRPGYTAYVQRLANGSGAGRKATRPLCTIWHGLRRQATRTKKH